MGVFSASQILYYEVFALLTRNCYHLWLQLHRISNPHILLANHLQLGTIFLIIFDLRVLQDRYSRDDVTVKVCFIEK